MTGRKERDTEQGERVQHNQMADNLLSIVFYIVMV